jgi:hypothetical protein
MPYSLLGGDNGIASTLGSKLGQAVSETYVRPFLALDYNFGNPLCYPGSGTTITDLSSKGNNATLISSPTYSPLNGGVFINTNSPTNKGIVGSASASLNWGANDVSAEFWLKLNSLGILNLYDTRPANDGNYITVYNNGSNRLVFYFATADRIVSSVTNNTTNYVHCVITRNSGVWRMYVNGVVQASTYTNAGSPALNPFQTLGRNGFNGLGSSNTTWGQTRIYVGLGLTAQQVLQNYNTTKTIYQ